VYDVWRVRRLCRGDCYRTGQRKGSGPDHKLLSAIMREKTDETVFNSAVLRNNYSLTYNCVASGRRRRGFMRRPALWTTIQHSDFSYFV
jgi:hypothetical protein